MRDVNVGDEADFSAVEALMLLSNHTTLGMITKMKKLSATIAVLFASASLSVLAQPATAPAKPAADTAKTTTPAAPAKADAAKSSDMAKTDAKADDTKGKKKPKHKKAPKKPKTDSTTTAAATPATPATPAAPAAPAKNDTKPK
jgi:hypothetical protein